MHPVLKRNFEIFSACDWLAALTAHIPNAGEHLVRYNGWYGDVKRGKRRKTQADDRLSVSTGSTGTIEACSEVSDSAAKRAWARLIKQVYEDDPLICPRCGSAMRIIAFSCPCPSSRLTSLARAVDCPPRRGDDGRRGHRERPAQFWRARGAAESSRGPEKQIPIT